MYEKELIALSKSGARYIVIGGIALGLSGYPRATFDLDILPQLSEENLDKIIKTLQKLGYKPRRPVNPEDIKDPEKRELWFKEKNMKVFSFFNPEEAVNEIDVMIYYPLNFEDCFKRRQIVKLKGHDIYISSIEDLLELKKISMRNVDIGDIEVLEKMLEKKKKEK
ncbi:MAG: hypothetical protein CVT88_09870 [Candidatus Altiarchaeales archaeon HGW-Altiarchaeales-1]|nr:MAG: hypothetical protein CVT88_09870 [Candidatus Altiarchaeales archaeon HGW-Altiarchaeales-1]